MNEELLAIDNLTVSYIASEEEALSGVSLKLRQGESIGIIGESGSGKTTLALGVMGLLKGKARVSGCITFDGGVLKEDVLPEGYRWKRAAMVFQNHLEVWNPVLTVREQIEECLRRHRICAKNEQEEWIRTLLTQVALAEEQAAYYPHQLSGGMRQRALLAMALSCKPELLILDEPTNALDMLHKEEILQLLERLCEKKELALLVISHELSVISRLTSRLAVLYNGCLLEEGPTGKVLAEPLHVYTRGLIASSPAWNGFRDLWGIPGEEEAEKEKSIGCPFYRRCVQKKNVCAQERPLLRQESEGRKVACHQGGAVKLLEARGLSKTFFLPKGSVEACCSCSLEIRSGEVVALVGASGSGKTTLGRLLSGLLSPDSGSVRFCGKEEPLYTWLRCKKGVQMVPQDPFSSLNPLFTVKEAVLEPLRILDGERLCAYDSDVEAVLKQVQLPTSAGFLARCCKELSGGQRQRVAIARALVLRPRLLVADEMTSMLDPSTQANLLRLLKGLQNVQGFSMLYITHDLAIARKIADRVCVMRDGEIVEQGQVRSVLTEPDHEYTKKLVQADAGFFDRKRRSEKI